MIFMTSKSRCGGDEFSNDAPDRVPAISRADGGSNHVKLSKPFVAYRGRGSTTEILAGVPSTAWTKAVVFQALATEELRRVLYIKIEAVLERIEAASQGKPSTVDIAGSARGFMLREGTDHDLQRPPAQACHRTLSRAPQSPI
jgi:hypothetical protein